jgi:hypothetical protein
MRNGAIIPFTDIAPVVNSAHLPSSKSGYSKAAEVASESQLPSTSASGSGAGFSTTANGGLEHTSTLPHSASTPSNGGTDDSITPNTHASEDSSTELLDEMRRLRERVTQLESRTDADEAPPGYQE